MKILFKRIIFGVTLFFLGILLAIQPLPLFFNQPDIINQTALQATRVQRIAKDAQILLYRPKSEHAQAVSELQNTLPAFESQQTKLRDLMNTDSKLLVSQSQSDYTSIDTSTKLLLAHPDDLTQIQIILDHERDYSLLMSQLSTLRQAQIQSNNDIFVTTQIGITILIIAGLIWFFILSRQPIPKREEPI